MAIFILMPALNETETIGAVVGAIPNSVNGRPVRVVVVDDGSTDDTAEKAQAGGAETVVSSVNQGKGSALRLGLDHVDGLDIDALVWMDSDGQHPPAALPTLVEPVLAGAADMVVGSRYLQASTSKAPLNRRMVRKATIAAIETVSGFRLTDPFSGYRCFSRLALDALALSGDRYECELEAFFSVAGAGLTIEEVPIPRIYGANTSKMGYRHGRILGRLKVVNGYAVTLVKGARGSRVEPRTKAVV